MVDGYGDHRHRAEAVLFSRFAGEANRSKADQINVIVRSAMTKIIICFGLALHRSDGSGRVEKIEVLNTLSRVAPETTMEGFRIRMLLTFTNFKAMEV